MRTVHKQINPTAEAKGAGLALSPEEV